MNLTFQVTFDESFDPSPSEIEEIRTEIALCIACGLRLKCTVVHVDPVNELNTPPIYPATLGLAKCSRCGGADPNCSVCQTDTPQPDPDYYDQDHDITSHDPD